MAAIKNLKKDIHNTLGDIIEACYVWEFTTPDSDASKAQVIVDEAIVSFDALMDKIHVKNVENKKVHFKSIQSDLENVAKSLVEKVNAL
jgi:nitrogen-specific signal transduction histidine kinase